MRRLFLTLFVLLALASLGASASPAAAASLGGSTRAKPATKRSAAKARVPQSAKLARRVATYARRQLGTPYRWGASSPRSGFDCSGLVYAAYRSVGRSIPRTTWGQLQAGRRVAWQRLRPGDLVFTNGGGHVVLVVSRNVAISAPRAGYRVRFVPLSALRGSFYGARRLL